MGISPADRGPLRLHKPYARKGTFSNLSQHCTSLPSLQPRRTNRVVDLHTSSVFIYNNIDMFVLTLAKARATRASSFTPAVPVSAVHFEAIDFWKQLKQVFSASSLRQQ